MSEAGRREIYAKTRRASVEHWRVMHALSQVDSRSECMSMCVNLCVSVLLRELCNFTLFGSYSTHPGAVHCEAEERKSIRGLRSKHKLG